MQILYKYYLDAIQQVTHIMDDFNYNLNLNYGESRRQIRCYGSLKVR